MSRRDKRTWKIRVRQLVIFVAIGGFATLVIFFVHSSKKKEVVIPSIVNVFMSYHTNIIKDTEENKNFRRVLFTGQKSQLVVMNIPPGGEVGEETHRYTEQTLFFLSGIGEGEIDGKIFSIRSGDVFVVSAGTQHNFRNTGTEDLKLYTVYAPPNHIDARVHRTKAAADADTEDEAVGQSKPPQ